MFRLNDDADDDGHDEDDYTMPATRSKKAKAGAIKNR